MWKKPKYSIRSIIEFGNFAMEVTPKVAELLGFKESSEEKIRKIVTEVLDSQERSKGVNVNSHNLSDSQKIYSIAIGADMDDENRFKAYCGLIICQSTQGDVAGMNESYDKAKRLFRNLLSKYAKFDNMIDESLFLLYLKPVKMEFKDNNPDAVIKFNELMALYRIIWNLHNQLNSKKNGF